MLTYNDATAIRQVVNVGLTGRRVGVQSTVANEIAIVEADNQDAAETPCEDCELCAE